MNFLKRVSTFLLTSLLFLFLVNHASASTLFSDQFNGTGELHAYNNDYVKLIGDYAQSYLIDNQLTPPDFNSFYLYEGLQPEDNCTSFDFQSSGFAAVMLRTLQNPNPEIGRLFQYDEIQAYFGQSWYYYHVDNDGTQISDTGPLVYDTGTTHNLRACVTGNTVTGYLDGNLFLTKTTATVGGYSGFGLAQGDKLDNFTISTVPVPFAITNFTLNHATQAYSFDYSGYTGGNISTESVAIGDNQSGSSTWQFNHEPASCTGGSSGSGTCSGIANHSYGSFNCANSVYVQIYGYNIDTTDYVSGLSNPDPYCSRQITNLSPAKIWVGLKNSDDVGVKFDLKAEAYANGNLVSSGETTSVNAGSSGFNNAKLDNINFNSFSPVSFPSGSTLAIKLYVRNACTGSGHNSGTARLWHNDSQANSLLGATINSIANNYYLVSSAALSTSLGSGPKQTVDVAAGAKCSAYKLFGTWTGTP